jgi:hypothetical protein
MPSNGYFIFTSETLPEYLSHKQLVDIVTTLPPASAVEQIKNTLSKINAYIPFSGLIIKNTIGIEKVEMPTESTPMSTQSSINSLRQTEENTEKLLSPSGIINIRDWMRLAHNLLPRFNQPASTGVDKNFSLKDKIFSKKRSRFFTLKKVFDAIKIIFVYTINFLILACKTLSDKKRMVGLGTNIKLNAREFISSTINKIKNSFVWFKGLNKRNKALFAIALVCLILLIQNIIWINYKNQKIETANALNELTQTIEQKQNQTEASLLYNNEEGAKKILDEIKSLLAEYPRDNKEQEEIYQRFIEKYREQINKISHVINIESPNKIANLSDLNSLANPDNMALISGVIYSSDSNSKTVYAINLADKTVTAIANTNPSYTKITKPAIDKNNNIFYLNDDKIIKLNIENEEFTPLTAELVTNFSQIAGQAVYNNRLYLLDNVDSKILRYNIGDNLSSPASWLTTAVDLTNTVDLAIDGNIFVLKNNGEVIKLLKGERQDFILSPVEPIMEAATKIEVSPEQKYIYILEPKQNRLIIFDKSGKFLSQYTSNSFSNLKDFAIDEINKKIYFLDHTTIYSIDADYIEK